MIRAEVAGIAPEKELEVWAGTGYLTIRAVRQGKLEDKHRTEFRYGSFSRTVQLPPTPTPTTCPPSTLTAS